MYGVSAASETYSMWFEDVERLKEAEDDVQSDDDDVEDSDTVKRRLTVTQQLRQLEAVLYHRADTEPYTRTHNCRLLDAMSLVRFAMCCRRPLWPVSGL